MCCMCSDSYIYVSIPEPSQSENSLPNISMEKEIGNIMAAHLKTLGEDGIGRFKYFLSLTEAPFEKSKIQTRHIKDKSVEDMVDLIISRHTMRHAQTTVEKVLDRMGETQIKMLIVEDISKVCNTNCSGNQTTLLLSAIIQTLVVYFSCGWALVALRQRCRC